MAITSCNCLAEALIQLNFPRFFFVFLNEIEQKQRSGLTRFNPLQPGVASLNPLRFPDVFRGMEKQYRAVMG